MPEVFEPVPARERRSWMISPAFATLVFIGTQLVLSVGPHPRGGADNPKGLRAAAAETPAAPVRVRVVSEIRRLGDAPRSAAPVPASERELLELFRKQGSVEFAPGEVEALGTTEKRFGPEEVEVITANGLRRARLAAPAPAAPLKFERPGRPR